MNQLRRTTQWLVAGMVLAGAVTIAQAETNKSDKTSVEHHSKMSKVAFWRHHNDASKNAKQNAKAAQSKPAQPKQAQVKPTSAKPSQGNKAQVKPVSAKQPSGSTAKKNTAKVSSAQPAKTQPKSMTAQNAHASQKDSPKQ
jgi:hypothetical protein